MIIEASSKNRGLKTNRDAASVKQPFWKRVERAVALVVNRRLIREACAGSARKRDHSKLGADEALS